MVFVNSFPTNTQYTEEQLQSALRCEKMINHMCVSCDVKYGVISITNIFTLVRREQNVAWKNKWQRVKFDIFNTKLAPLPPSHIVPELFACRCVSKSKRINWLSDQVSSIFLGLWCTLGVIGITLALTWRVCRNIQAAGADWKGKAAVTCNASRIGITHSWIVGPGKTNLLTLCQMVSSVEDSNMSAKMIADLEQKLRNVQVSLIVLLTHQHADAAHPTILYLLHIQSES